MSGQNPNGQALPQHAINIAKLPKLGTTLRLSLDEPPIDDQHMEALIYHLGALDIETLNAQLTFRPWSGHGVRVEGNVAASLHTQCAITLEPVAQIVNLVFKAAFVAPTSKFANPQLNEDREWVLNVDDELPDILDGEHLDAWAITLEHLILEIDPFARAQGAEFKSSQPQDDDIEENESPFAVLQSLKK